MKLHDAIMDLIDYEEEFTAEDWKFLASYGAVADVRALREHEREKLKKSMGEKHGKRIE